MSSLECMCRGKNGRCNTRYTFSKISSLPDLPKNISTERFFFCELVLVGTHVCHSRRRKSQKSSCSSIDYRT